MNQESLKHHIASHTNQNHTRVPNATKNLKEMVTLKVTCQSILRKNDTFVNFVVMAHILKGTLHDT